MTLHALYGIDKYHHARLICAIEAEDIAAAARKLGGAVSEIGVAGEDKPAYRLVFDEGYRAAVFAPGPCTDEALAASAEKGDPSADVGRLIASYRYGTRHIYRQYLLGEIPLLRP